MTDTQAAQSVDLPWTEQLLADGRGPLPFVVNGRAVLGTYTREFELRDDSGRTRSVSFAGADAVDTAAVTAAACRAACAALSRGTRSAILRSMADRLENSAEELALSISLEVGKAIRDAAGEVKRCVSTLRVAADAVTALTGQEVALDAVDVGAGRLGFTTWRPIGVVAAICGFNFPLLLAVHKVSAAIGAGCPVIVKPSERTPFTTLCLARAAVDAGWPADAISILNGEAEVGSRMVEHSSVSLVSFTGSSAVGAKIAERAGRHLKKVVLELGSNAATIVAEDADLELAARRCAEGAMATSGQSCISVQRIIAHEAIVEELSEAISAHVRAMKPGSLLEPDTQVGPLIAVEEEKRVAAMIADATSRGARMLVGSEDEKALKPTILVDVPPGAMLAREEAFGPVAAIFPYKTVEQAIELANSTPYGLMAGVFTDSLDKALRFAEQLDVGGVHINDSSNFRPDNLPYGGVKASGIGKEGPAYAMREMSIEKVITIRGERAPR